LNGWKTGFALKQTTLLLKSGAANILRLLMFLFDDRERAVYKENSRNGDVLDMAWSDDKRVSDVLVQGESAACGARVVDWFRENSPGRGADYPAVSESTLRESEALRNDLPPAPSIPRQENPDRTTPPTPPRQARTRVYICGPINGSGKVTLNVRRAVEVASTLLKRGYAPYVPHLNCLWEISSGEDFSVEEWLTLDFEFLSACDAVLRLPGESPGADREVALAKKLKIAVYHSLDTLCACEKAVRWV
jgi:hypothetical protein